MATVSTEAPFNIDNALQTVVELFDKWGKFRRDCYLVLSNKYLFGVWSSLTAIWFTLTAPPKEADFFKNTTLNFAILREFAFLFRKIKEVGNGTDLLATRMAITTPHVTPADFSRKLRLEPSFRSSNITHLRFKYKLNLTLPSDEELAHVNSMKAPDDREFFKSIVELVDCWRQYHSNIIRCQHELYTTTENCRGERNEMNRHNLLATYERIFPAGDFSIISFISNAETNAIAMLAILNNPKRMEQLGKVTSREDLYTLFAKFTKECKEEESNVKESDTVTKPDGDTTKTQEVATNSYNEESSIKKGVGDGIFLPTEEGVGEH